MFTSKSSLRSLLLMILLMLGLTEASSEAAPVFSPSRRGTYDSILNARGYVDGQLTESDSVSGLRFVVGQSSINLGSGAGTITLASDKTLRLRVYGVASDPYPAGIISITGSGKWRWTNSSTLSMNGTSTAVIEAGSAPLTWNATLKFPSPQKAEFKITFAGQGNGHTIKLVFDIPAQK